MERASDRVNKYLWDYDAMNIHVCACGSYLTVKLQR